MSEDRKTVVSSGNEWDPLKYVIVDRADMTMVQAPEIAGQRDWTDEGFPLRTNGPFPEEMTAKTNEQMVNFTKILEERRVRVDRPEISRDLKFNSGLYLRYRKYILINFTNVKFIT